MPAANLSELIAWAGAELRVAEMADYPPALNGLQLENDGRITRIAAAVDACEPVIADAIAREANLLVVHHGLFWPGLQRLTGAAFRKLQMAVRANLAIYSVHLPLDLHPELGNNVLLMRALGFAKTAPFLMHQGSPKGLRTESNLTRHDLAARLQQATGGRVHVCPGGPEICRHIGVVTGGAGSEVAAAAAEGVDTFITGEGPHWSYTLAEELGINVMYGGHYATETFGVKALAEAMAARASLPWFFIDHPSGL